MKIVLFHPFLTSLGGAEMQVMEHGRLLHDQGHQVEVLTFEYDEGRWRDRLTGIPVQVATRRHWTDSLSLSEVSKLERRARRVCEGLAGCDLAIAHNHPCHSMLGVGSPLTRKVWYCHEPPRALYFREAGPYMAGITEGQARRSSVAHAVRALLHRHDARLRSMRSTLRAKREVDRRGVQGLSSILANSQFTADNFQRVYGIRPADVVYPMVRLGGSGISRRGLDRSGLHVLVQGRMELLKNQEGALRGFAEFRRRNPSAHLHLVGEGDQRRSLQALAETLLPQDAVTFHGFLSSEALAALYRRCDVFALLPLDEPFGMVFPEAASRGLLLVGPDHGGPQEILEGGRYGWGVDPFDPEAFAEALARIWALPDAEVQRRRMEADAACRARYAPEVVGPQLLRALHL
jgi:glycosyltransferase involved in cell wall biosynthesis